MTLPDELKQEVGREVIRTILHYSFIAFIVKLCFEILLSCPEPACCKSKLFKRLTSFKSMYICQWIGAACLFFYNKVIAPFTVDDIPDPDKAASAQRTHNFIMNYVFFWLVASPFAFIYLRRLGWFQDDAPPGKTKKKKGGKASEKEERPSTREGKEEEQPSDKDSKEDEYVLPAVRKRRL